MTVISADNVNRTQKLLMDLGKSGSVEEAEATLQGFILQVVCGARIASSATMQAALLTIVNTASRCFLGGVQIVGCPASRLLINYGTQDDLHAAVRELGGDMSSDLRPTLPTIQIDSEEPMESANLRITFEGWRAGVVPVTDVVHLPEKTEFVISGIFAGAVAVAEVFQFLSQTHAEAARRPVGISLWNLSPDFLNDNDSEPSLVSLPKSFWLIGLGHIGQAFLWSFGMLPFDDPASVEMVLQDVDALSTANLSTSVLTATTSVGKRKTREVAQWIEARGFKAHIVERRFANNFKIADREPHLGICAVDNSHARAALEKVGFDEVIEAGLGSRGEEYLAFQIHKFPASRSTELTWPPTRQETPAEIDQTLATPAYQRLARSGMDICGLTTLAGKAVGASFVGVAVSVLMLAELLRSLHNGPQVEMIDGTFRSLGRLRSITSVSKQTIRRATTIARHQ